MSNQTNPLDVQVGGDHYKTYKTQPVEFTMKNGWDFCAGNALKYLMRHRAKGGKEDVKKARHYVELRRSLGAPRPTLPIPISIEKFVYDNDIKDSDTAQALFALSDHVYYDGVKWYDDLMKKIDLLEASYST